jgi:PAS domain S-box-containing protein
MGTAATAQKPQLGKAGLLALVEKSPDGIFVSDAEGRLTYVNASACRLVCRGRDELIGMLLTDLLPPTERDRLRKCRAAVLRNGVHAGEWSLRRRDGSSVAVEVHATAVGDGQWQAFARDVSERKGLQAEREALFERIATERRWRQAVMDTLPLGVMLFEPGGKISANRHTEELFGTRLAGSGSDHYAGRLLYPDGKPVPKSELVSSRVMARGETIIGAEYLIVRPDGSQIPVLGSAAPILVSEGHIIGGVGVLQDASDRMRLEQTVRANERLLKAVFELLPVGLWIADRQGRVTLSNPAAERIWQGPSGAGTATREHKGWWADSGEPVEPQEWPIQRAIRNGETSRSALMRIQCFDGSSRTVIHWAAPIRSDSGEVTGAVAVTEDVTALHQTQEQLRGAVREREEILAVVTHDLRNPLSALRLVASAAERKSRKLADGEPLRAMATSILEITRSMSALVDDLMSIAVEHPGHSMLKLAPVDARLLLERAAQAARPQFARAGIELEVEHSGPLPLLQVDANRILRVFANLMDNALKFTEAPGKAVLRAEALSCGVRYCVANTGPALDGSELEAMFQPFWQSGRQDRRGAGLGLAICRSIVEAHGGSIWAEPSHGYRVRVCCLLPSEPSSAGTPQQSGRQAAGQPKMP